MKFFTISFFICLKTLFAQVDSTTLTATTSLEAFAEYVQKGQYEEARKFLIDESLTEEQLKDLQTIVDKVLLYINSDITSPSKEGSKQYSIRFRDSVLFLLIEEGKLYITKGTTSKIPHLLKMARLLETPEKTMNYFIQKVTAGEYKEASTCFVPDKDKSLEKDEMDKFAAVLKKITEQQIEGDYQGKTQKSLVSYPFGNYSISLANENSDWLFTIYTRSHINLLYSQLKHKSIANLIPQKFNERLFFIKNWQWIGILLILLVGVVAQWLFKLMFNKAIAQKLDMVNEHTNRTNYHSVTIFSIALCWYLLFPLLGLDEDTAVILTNAAGIMAMISALFVVSKVIDFFKDILLKKAEKSTNKVDDVLIPMLHKVIKLAVIVIGVVLIASNIGINVASLLAGIGLIGMAIALAAKDTVENLFGSVTVLLDKPFEVGDFVSINGVDGIIEQIGLRSTRIRTFYRSQVNVPNSTLIRATVDNYGRRNCRRIKTSLSLTYDTPPDKIEAFCEGIRQLIRNHPYTVKDNYHVYFTEFNAASLDVLLLCYIDTGDYAIELRERQRLFTDIIRLAGRLEVDFAFPTQTIHMAKAEDLYDAEKQTSLQKINDALISGRELGSKILSESLPEKSQLPATVDYLKGNSYFNKSPSK